MSTGGTHYHYGKTFEQVGKIRHPVECSLLWGTQTVCIDRQEFSLRRLDLPVQSVHALHFHRTQALAYLVEVGCVLAHQKTPAGETTCSLISKGQVFQVGPGVSHGFVARESSVMYVFAPGPHQVDEIFWIETPSDAIIRGHGALAAGAPTTTGAPTTDVRDKYWGTIENVVNGEVAGKRILLRAGGQSSLEFHISKIEAYYVHSGRVRVGVRVGRAENRSLDLYVGDVFEILPGTMHMRMGLEDAVIIEVSTRDSDSDSHLVEDGTTYKHIEK